MWTITVPLVVPISKNKTFSLNLNIYRNAHFRVLHKAKEVFTTVVTPLIKEANIPMLSHISMRVVIFPGSNRLVDIANIAPIVAKFFDDALVQSGVLPDDNYTYIPFYCHSFGSVDKDNPRAEITIIPLDSQNKDIDMQFKLTQETVQDLVLAHVNSMITVADDVELDVVFEEDGTVTVRLVKQADVPAKASKPKATKTVKKEEEPRPEPKVQEPSLEDESEEDPLDIPAVAEDVAETEQVEEKPKASPSKGLFANIKRPTN